MYMSKHTWKKLLLLVMTAAMLVSLLPRFTSTEAAGEKLIAITFDDGPSAYTSSLLDGLKERGAHVTFFMTGVNGNNGVTFYRSLLHRMWEEGHQLANHTYSHVTVTSISAETLKSQLNGVSSVIYEELGGSYQMMLRTPGGAVGSTVRTYAGMPIILWGVDTNDWKYKDSDYVYNYIINNAKDGSIVLLHDLYKTSCNAALRAIDTLKSRGYEFVTVAELMRRKGVTLSNGSVYTQASPSTIKSSYSAPQFETNENRENGAVTLTISGEDGLTFYYTTDGSYPYLDDSVYSAPIQVTKDTTFTVIGVDKYGTRTPVSTVTVKAAVPPLEPVISYNDDTKIMTLTAQTANAEIRYTTDGSAPTASSTLYTEPFEISSGTVKAVAVGKTGYLSGVVSCSFTPKGTMFFDVTESDWYYDVVSEAVDSGLMNGVGNFQFDPNSSTSRAMMVTVLYRLAGSPEIVEPETSPETEDAVEPKDTTESENTKEAGDTSGSENITEYENTEESKDTTESEDTEEPESTTGSIDTADSESGEEPEEEVNTGSHAPDGADTTEDTSGDEGEDTTVPDNADAPESGNTTVDDETSSDSGESPSDDESANEESEVDKTTIPTFADVKEGSWYYNAVRWAAVNGIVTGVDSEHFAPNDLLTRGQMILMIYRFTASLGIDTTLPDDVVLPDEPIPDYMRDAVVWAIGNGILQGDSNGKLAVKENTNRAQCAAMLLRTQNLIESYDNPENDSETDVKEPENDEAPEGTGTETTPPDDLSEADDEQTNEESENTESSEQAEKSDDVQTDGDVND